MVHVRAVYFYFSLLWHTNWPNVFLWWINYWLSWAWMRERRRFKRVWSADVQSISSRQVSVSSKQQRSGSSDTSNQVFSSSSSELRSFIAIYASIRWDMMLKHGNWLLILFDNKFRKYLEKKLMDFDSFFQITRNFGDQ